MEYEFSVLKRTREHFVNFLEYYEMEALLAVPNGFRNNMFWNIAHALCTQQLLHYLLTDNTLLISTEFVNAYKKGTKPSFEEVKENKDELIKLLRYTPENLKKDYESEKLAYFKEYETSYGLKLKSIEEAIRFNNAHENLHLGYVMALRKAIL